MPTAIVLASAILLAQALPGQEPPQQEEARVFHLTRTESAQDVQEVATVIRSITDIRHVMVDADQKAIVLRAAPARMAAAEWLINELDARVPGRPRSRTLTSGEHRLTGGENDLLRVFFLAQSAAPQELQEMATVIRSLGDIRWTFTYNRPMAIVIRGTRAQLALTEWLVKELDRPENRQAALRRNLSAAAQEYRAPEEKENAVRVLYLKHGNTPQRLQETAVAVRTASQVRRVFTFNAAMAMALRGTPEQAAQAERIAAELDQPPK